MPISFPACQKITLFSTAHLLRRVLCIKWKPSLPFNVHSLDSDVDIHQKDTLDLAIHPSCLKALNDGGCLRLNQVLSKELKVKSPPLTSSTPPPPSLARAWGECFHSPMGLKHYKNLTWQTKGRHGQCTDSPRERLTEGTTLLPHPPPT